MTCASRSHRGLSSSLCCCVLPAGGILRANALRNPLLRFLRRIGLGILTRIPSVRQTFVSTAAEDTVSYTNSSLAKPTADSSAGTGGLASAKCAGTAFPDVSIMMRGVMRPATDLLRGGEGCFGTLVLFEPDAESAAAAAESEGQAGLQDGGSGSSNVDESSLGGGVGVSSSKAGAVRPTRWGHWPLHVVYVARGPASRGSEGGDAGAVDAWGLLSEYVGGADGVLVRPDGIIAAAGGPQDVAAWLKVHC
jgi:hypothetical protein